MGNRFTEKLAGLGQLSEDDLAILGAVTAQSRTVTKRRDLIREGARPGPIFVILEGWACRYKILPNGGRQVLAFLMPGDFCDHHGGLLAEMDHSIQTLTSVEVATIGRQDMDSLMDRQSIAKAIYRAQLGDEATMRAWITSMGRRTSIERVAHLMCELYLRARTIGLTAAPNLTLPLSQLLLADSLGMTPVHLNRVLKELRLTGAMTLQRGNLVISNPGQLVQIAGFDENYLQRRLRQAA
jgi:CRP-like cAMP-binding protein